MPVEVGAVLEHMVPFFSRIPFYSCRCSFLAPSQINNTMQYHLLEARPELLWMNHLLCSDAQSFVQSGSKDRPAQHVVKQLQVFSVY